MSASTTTIEAPAAKKTPVPMNGVNTPALFATIDVVRNQPQLGAFQFRATGEWLSGTHMRTMMSDFSGAGGEHTHATTHTAEADHPAVLCGEDRGPTPVEYILHALAACLTAGTSWRRSSYPTNPTSESGCARWSAPCSNPGSRCGGTPKSRAGLPGAKPSSRSSRKQLA